MMVGAAWYTGVFHDTLKTPAGELTAAPPLQWGTGHSGHDRPDRWRAMDHLQAHQQPVGRCGLRQVVRDGLQPPADQPRCSGWPSWISADARAVAYGSDLEHLLGSGSGPGYQGRSQPDLGWLGPGDLPDQPVWSNTVIPGLVAGKSLSSLMPAFGKALGQAAQAAGYTVATS